ncbi:MAG: HAMP domain-containing sensor histidine kinase [Terrimicrobiaceae bacterium]|nr:HAMP domain-containing sensor histidine kinase [Terrimicrobiaceae bacterium]
MMHEFLSAHKEDLIARCIVKVAKRPSPRATATEMEHGIPMFLDHLIEILRAEQTSPSLRECGISDAADKNPATLPELNESAARHGRELMDRGFTVEQVVRDYGDLCQAITELAFEVKEPIGIDEFRTLNCCLDNAIAIAVTEFNFRRDFVVANTQAEALNERLGIFAHELRNLLNAATLSLSALKAGNLSVHGATAGVLDRSLVGMGNLINRSLNEVRMVAGQPLPTQVFSVTDFIGEVNLSASLEAIARNCSFTMTSTVDPNLALEADRDLLLSAVGNLLQNAFKFTRPESTVALRAYAERDRVRLDVADQGPGLPPGSEQTIFESFVQSGEDRSGLGLGLSIAKRSVEANKGVLSVRSQPGVGCVFTIDLPCQQITPPEG